MSGTGDAVALGGTSRAVAVAGVALLQKVIVCDSESVACGVWRCVAAGGGGGRNGKTLETFEWPNGRESGA